MIKKNAARFAKEMYKTDTPTAEQIAGATSMLANTAQNLVDNNLSYDVPYSKQAEAFLHKLQVEYSSTSSNLSIGNGQYLFYASTEQKNQLWLNAGTVDKEIAGLIIKAPIKPTVTPGIDNTSRDRLTGLPLDDKGRYSQRVVINDETYASKYFSCATPECLGHNLDISDSGTRDYVKALDRKVLSDIGNAASVVSLVTPIGPIGQAAAATGVATNIASAFTGDLAIALGKEATMRGADKYLTEVLKISSSTATRIISLIDLAGGWDAFVTRTSDALHGKESKK